jgi:hypothetical protein
MTKKLCIFIIGILFLYGCGSGENSSIIQKTCAGDVNETYLRITHQLVTQSDLEAAQ